MHKSIKQKLTLFGLFYSIGNMISYKFFHGVYFDHVFHPPFFPDSSQLATHSTLCSLFLYEQNLQNLRNNMHTPKTSQRNTKLENKI